MYETLLLTCRLIIVDSSQDLTNMGGLSQKFTNGTQLVSTLHNLMLHMVREWYVQCVSVYLLLTKVYVQQGSIGTFHQNLFWRPM